MIMHRAPELKRLPKPPRFQSINFRHQTPGSISYLLNFSKSPNPLDPSHPAQQTPHKRFPSVNVKLFRVSAFPQALLNRPEIHRYSYDVDTWERRVTDEPGRVLPLTLDHVKPNTLPMSFSIATSKKQTHKKRYIRLGITRTIKEILKLIVLRGAQSRNGKLVFDDEEVHNSGDTWILPGWSYVFYPSFEMYSMPYAEIIPKLRSALRKIWTAGVTLEEEWESRALSTTKTPARKRASERGTLPSVSSTPLRFATPKPAIPWRERAHLPEEFELLESMRMLDSPLPYQLDIPAESPTQAAPSVRIRRPHPLTPPSSDSKPPVAGGFRHHPHISNHRARSPSAHVDEPRMTASTSCERAAKIEVLKHRLFQAPLLFHKTKPSEP